ncbi:hypothetical protein PHLGIDRAFT_252469 [Phlebiopsis gigantea 11061_1 CR5-6]|uniref:Tyrosine specific protein phosphatases domain-containing protein n=1 Tax=Phlebiopsis gigantea (strain 11061_1 CR5-6) TaxID=745531 RepID=A0A0C3S1M0_PHLG1|nr:hypothetical protein PHLGIDRAFT_252469 [Phlebiopsis gigantea 11061_1 CR5-6]
MDLQLFCGSLSLVGERLQTLADDIDTASYSFVPTDTPHHITLATKDELRTLKGHPSPHDILSHIRRVLADEPIKLHPLGLGGYPAQKPEVFFVVVVWAKGQQLRRALGLSPKQFHMTLSQKDEHNVDKGVASLLHKFPEHVDMEALDHLIFTLHALGDFLPAKQYAIRLCQTSSTSEKGYLRLGDCALKLIEYKLAMLAYSCAYDKSGSRSDTKLQEYCLQKIISCAQETEWGTVCTGRETEQLPEQLADVLLASWSPELHAALRSQAPHIPTLTSRLSRDQLFIPAGRNTPDRFYRLPRFFRWLLPFRIALMSTPRNATDIAALGSRHLNIRHVLTLTEESPLETSWFSSGKVKNTFLPIPNYHPPTIEQMDLIVRLLQEEDNLPILIHCGGGKGRAGTVAACYLAAFGFRVPPISDVPTQPAMSAPEAIATLRAIRPGSLETEQQEAFVGRWCSTIWKRQSVFPEAVPEPPPCSLELEGTLNASSNLFLLVGLPGSGKSWFCRALLSRDPARWSWISQDESGSRSACETAVGHQPGKCSVLLDRCNTSQDDRKVWLALAENWSVAPVCVWFDYEPELCTYRAQNRAGHPTLPPGRRVRNAVDQMRKLFVLPTLSEGFSAVVKVKSFAAAEELVSQLSPRVALFKFPRTPHLLNLGAATDDDQIDDTFGPTPSTHVVITEKVDGANMGFSLSADRTHIIVQNRSHYVTPSSHAQFKKLGTWVDSHRADLHKVLDRDPFFPQRYVLFGEWLAATHSVSYSRLPDWFLAFDLYDRSTKSWADRVTLTAVLADTNIKVVPVLYQGPMPDEDTLKGMVQRQSHYTEGRLEGVYVKIERGGQAVGRGKVVRGDFIAGNEHWTKGPLHTNQVAYMLGQGT